MRKAFFVIFAGALAAFPQGAASNAGAATRPLFSSSVRLEDWALFRSASTAILGWKVAVPANAFPQVTFWEAAAKADALGVASIVGFSDQKLSAEIPKNLDYKLAPGELEAVRDRLRALSMRMPAYFTPTLGPDENTSRRVFEFARALNIETIISSATPRSLPLLDKLANEFSVNLAIPNATAGDVLPGRSARIGISLEASAGSLKALSALKDRVMAVTIRGRAAALPEFFHEMYRLGIKPSVISVEPTGSGDPSADLSRTFEDVDKALHPVLTESVNQIARSAAIRGPDRLSPEDRRKIEASLPQRASVQPKKSRKLLVLDLNVAYPGHRSIPHANLALELMGKKTGAYEAVFSNDLENLKYARIKQFDAVYLNNTVGMVFVDPEVRDGLTRFVREGGGLAGNHGVSHASMDWAEFGEMIGTKWGVHREATERATIHIEDPKHPLTAAFKGREFVYEDEFFRFPKGPYSRDKLRVLLTIDVEKTDMNQGRPCAKPCVRPDNDYAVSWIRGYGKGRVFFCILGHNPTLYMTPRLAEYFLAGIQFILGDLEADTTPSAHLRSRND